MASRVQISARLCILAEQIEKAAEDLVVEDNATQEASDTLGTVLDLMREAQGYLDEDDPNTEG